MRVGTKVQIRGSAKSAAGDGKDRTAFERRPFVLPVRRAASATEPEGTELREPISVSTGWRSPLPRSRTSASPRSSSTRCGRSLRWVRSSSPDSSPCTFGANMKQMIRLLSPGAPGRRRPATQCSYAAPASPMQARAHHNSQEGLDN